MNKELLLEKIISTLQATYESSLAAAMRAYDTATNEENVAENKYDTLALEASYLAHGQALRVVECETDIAAFKKLRRVENSAESGVTLGSLIALIDEQNKRKYIFLGPSAGGLKLIYESQEVIIVTPNSPLGEALIGRELNDEINLSIGKQIMNYEIEMIC